MSLRITVLIIAVLLVPPVLLAQQHIHGSAQYLGSDGAVQPLPDARVGWVEGAATMTDDDGRFLLNFPEDWPARLVVTSFATTPDTLVLDGPPKRPLRIVVGGSVELRAAEVTERQASTRLSLQTLEAIESIGQRELKRAACCDVSESFETNATVDVNYSDAVSGTKTIRMLGLDGKYALIDVENVPFVRGLSSNYGLTLLPGPWIHGINVSKGVGTAVNGPNAMTGQIDLGLLDPAVAPGLFANLYTNSHGQAELNVNAAQHLGKAGDNILMVHGSMLQSEIDDNADGFRDTPLSKRFNILDRWIQRTEHRFTQAIIRYVTDQREGGQATGAPYREQPGGQRYRAELENEMVDLIVKNGWILKDQTKSIGLIGSLRQHEVKGTFGDRRYRGTQRSGYASVLFQQLLANEDQLKAGASIQYDEYDERFQQPGEGVMDLGRVENMPGLFAEYTRSRNRFTMVAGLRADLNSRYGEVVSPRLHMKYDLGPLTTVRFSGGGGFRSANPLVEHGAVMASSRRVTVEGDLGLERSWNNGLSLLHKFRWLGKRWTVGADFYRTDFIDQVVADVDRDPQQIIFYMLDGRSFANSLLADIHVQLSKQIDMKASYRWYDARTTYSGTLRDRPLAPAHRGLVDMGYVSLDENWRFDITLNMFGSARMPLTGTNPEEHRLRERSPAYGTLNAQLTRVLGAWELYLGGENLTGALQTRQILSPNDPFGPYFDASMIWGPTSKQMAYFGLRYTLNHN